MAYVGREGNCCAVLVVFTWSSSKRDAGTECEQQWHSTKSSDPVGASSNEPHAGQNNNE